MSKNIPKSEKLELFSRKIFKKCLEYSDIDPETNKISIKVVFFGISQYPNVPSIINFDILYLYKALQELHIEALIHDPYIAPTEALLYGLHIGRQSRYEKWSHSFDVVILSTPHNFYLSNINKLINLFKPHKPNLWLDLYGYTHPATLVNYDNVTMIDFSEQAKEAELLGAPKPPLVDWKDNQSLN